MADVWRVRRVSREEAEQIWPAPDVKFIAHDEADNITAEQVTALVNWMRRTEERGLPYRNVLRYPSLPKGKFRGE